MTVWQVGESKVGPGVYIRATKFGQTQIPGLVQGYVGLVVRAPWGPLAQAVTIESLAQIDEVYGTGQGTDLIREALLGGAIAARVVRVGSGGASGTSTIQDTAGTPVNAVTITARYPGTRVIGYTNRDSLSDPTNTRELLVYEQVAGVWTLRQVIRYTKGTANGGEPQKLVNAVTAAGSNWITATFVANGNNLLATVGSPTPVTLTGGSEPSTVSAEYTTALGYLETSAEWNVMAIDTSDTTIQASAIAFIDRIRNLGLRRMLVVAEPTSIAFATQTTNSRAMNNPAVVYWSNGFNSALGAKDGWVVSGRLAGMIAATPFNRAITNVPVQGATSVIRELTPDQKTQAILAGAGFFSTSPTGQVRVHYGITTFITETGDLDLGWSKIRRVRTRDYLLNRIDLTWDAKLGQVDNDDNGRAALLSDAQGVVNEMIAARALISGEVRLDPARPPQGDSVWFEIMVDDVDSAEKVYLTAYFRYAPPA
jgi:Phage tail sheath protein subtilisin-like domain/Phage tail sheath C-terminal domain